MRFTKLAPVVLALAGCVTEPSVLGIEAQEVTLRPAGRHYQLTELPTGDTIRYTLYVPTGLDSGGRVPLVVAAHFGGQVTPWMGGDFADLLITPAFSDLRAVILAPDARRPSGWGSADEAGVIWLTRRVLEVYPIDPAKVVVTGFSAGGAQTWSWANRNQDLFTAAIPVSARPQATSAPWRIPVYVIHSRDDGLIPLEPVEQYVAAQRATGARIELQVVTGITHYQTSAFAVPLRESLGWLRSVWP
jgi:predicted peptidase